MGVGVNNNRVLSLVNIIDANFFCDGSYVQARVAGGRISIFDLTSELTRDIGHEPFKMRAVSCPICVCPAAPERLEDPAL